MTDITQINTLTNEQRYVLHELLLGNNIALLGAAGCGKSYLLSVIYTEFPGLKKSMTNKLPRIQMCALTGCAALLLGHKAKTLHSWAGIGLGKGTVSELYVKIRRNQKSMRNWLCTELLIIDEISMMTAELLDKLNELAKKIRSNQKPFGGIQILLVGDFFQLPPINKGDEPIKFAFESDMWKTITISIELTQILRQKDEVFQKVLKESRIGSLTQESCNILSSRQGLNWKINKIRPTLIFPKRNEVDMINDNNLRSLTGRRYNYKAGLVYDGKMPDGFTETDEQFQRSLTMFDSNASYAKELELIINAQVMLISNIDPDLGLVNGSRGIITGFSLELPIVEFLNGAKKTIGTHTWPIEDYEFVSRTQIPLRLAWATTIHKIQGSTLDSALVDIGSGVFEYGQAYVALSRVRNLDALYVYDFDPIAFKAHPKVKEFYKNLVVNSHINVDDFRATINFNVNSNIKQIMSEHSMPIRAINVIKELDEIIGPESDVPIPDVPIPDVPIPDVPIPDVPENNVIITPTNWLYDSVPDTWKDILVSCKDKLLELSTILSTKEFLPSRENIWNALIPIESIKVVILGQDPYPTPGNAHGLAFSVLPNVPIPASLKNIYKELTSDGFVAPKHGCLEEWTKQGVMLLNTVLTVEAGSPQSHSKIGWEEITDQIIRSIAARSNNIIFVLWGKSAQVKKKILGLYLQKHKIFESAHPSPLSASKGFFGSKPFSTINELLKEMDKEPIMWNI